MHFGSKVSPLEKSMFVFILELPLPWPPDLPWCLPLVCSLVKTAQWTYVHKWRPHSKNAQAHIAVTSIIFLQHTSTQDASMAFLSTNIMHSRALLWNLLPTTSFQHKILGMICSAITNKYLFTLLLAFLVHIAALFIFKAQTHKANEIMEWFPPLLNIHSFLSTLILLHYHFLCYSYIYLIFLTKLYNFGG